MCPNKKTEPKPCFVHYSYSTRMPLNGFPLKRSFLLFLNSFYFPVNSFPHPASQFSTSKPLPLTKPQDKETSDLPVYRLLLSIHSLAYNPVPLLYIPFLVQIFQRPLQHYLVCHSVSCPSACNAKFALNEFHISQ